MNSYHFETKNNQYTVEGVGFIIGAMKITCTGTIYLDKIGDQKPIKIESAVGFGFKCSDALLRMLDSVPNILSDYEETSTNVIDESYDKPGYDDMRHK